MTSRGKGPDRELGMGRRIQRRDFLNGAAVGIGALGLSGGLSGGVAWAAEAGVWPQDRPGYYPPALQGLRGSHPGAFEAAHALRDGQAVGTPSPTGEVYDLVVVGAGISGLSAAYFWRRERPDARILILDNHDDFGGHAKRNEVKLNGRMRLMNGGTLMIDSPRPYSPVADGLLKELGVDPVVLSKACEVQDFYHARGMGLGFFFDRETFGQDKLVGGLPDPRSDETPALSDVEAFVSATPLSSAARNDLRRLLAGGADPWPDLNSDAKKDRLSRMSYEAYLRDALKMHPAVVDMWRSATKGEWTVGIDAVSALDAWGFGLPGFSGLKLAPGATPRMSFTPAGYCQGGSYTFHFPDGNASIARLLVRSLIPAALSGVTTADIVTARADYSQLDRKDQAVRLRLSATVLGVRQEGGPAAADAATVIYSRGGQLQSVKGRQVVLACYNMIIPYLVPDLPEPQKAALHDLVKEPLVYATVGIRNWRAFERLKISSVHAPGGYYTSYNLDPIVNIGGYRGGTDPDQPTLIRMTRTPCVQGLSEHDQNRAGRAELLTTPFETFEREMRAELGRHLGAAGFDPARDVNAFIVNRWPHGYAPERNFLWEAELPHDQLPQVVGRQRFGRIAIANSDCGGGAYTDVAIDMAHRAVSELL